MSNQAGPGPFVLIYRPDASIQGPNLGFPLLFPAAWPWDRALPEGWAACPLTENVSPVVREEPPRADGEPRGGLLRGTRYAEPAEPRDVPIDLISGTEDEILARAEDLERTREADEHRLAHEALCKDMAFRMVGQLERAVTEGGVTAAREALDLARELYQALPEGE